jgi:glycerol-3-phosphate acyltransferase PlsY
LYAVAALIIGYVVGSIPFGYLVGRVRGIDVREFGSGATGGTNVLRTLGVGAAIITGLSDLLKGTLAAYIGYRLFGDVGYALAGFGALIGHSYPVWLRFKGGKSVATGAGALLLFHPLPFLFGLTGGLAAMIPTRYVSLGSLVGSILFCGTIWVIDVPLPHKLLAAGAFAVVFIRHGSNMRRIMAGTENRFGEKAKPRTET